MISICCVGFASLGIVCDELVAWSVAAFWYACIFVIVIVRTGGAIWLNPFATVLFTV